MAGHLSWFKVYAAETLSDERFSGWSVEERGAWFTLLLHAWREGSVPSDQSSLARLLHVDASAMRSLWSAIGDRFVEHPDHPGRLTSPRLEKEREAGQEMLARKSAAGKVGATSRWDKKNKRYGSRMAAASEGNADTMRIDGASGQHSAGKPQGSNSTESPPPPIQTKAQHQAAQAPLAQALLDALSAAGWSLTHAAPDKRAVLEAALATAGTEPACALVRGDLDARAAKEQETPGSLGFYVGDLVALSKRRAARPAEATAPPLPDIDLAWIDQLPEPRRAAARAAWEAKRLDVERVFPSPTVTARVLASSAAALRQEFTQ